MIAFIKSVTVERKWWSVITQNKNSSITRHRIRASRFALTHPHSVQENDATWTLDSVREDSLRKSNRAFWKFISDASAMDPKIGDSGRGCFVIAASFWPRSVWRPSPVPCGTGRGWNTRLTRHAGCRTQPTLPNCTWGRRPSAWEEGWLQSLTPSTDTCPPQWFSG